MLLQCAVPSCEGALTHAEAAAVEVWAVVRVAVREVATEVVLVVVKGEVRVEALVVEMAAGRAAG